MFVYVRRCVRACVRVCICVLSIKNLLNGITGELTDILYEELTFRQVMQSVNKGYEDDLKRIPPPSPCRLLFYVV